MVNRIAHVLVFNLNITKNLIGEHLNKTGYAVCTCAVISKFEAR